MLCVTQCSVMIGIHNDEAIDVFYAEAVEKDKPLDKLSVKGLDELPVW
ncbi:hypothetical protein [Phocaeicola sartorii]|nr:hypothetical protein [Phocaeicola sartorii]MCR1845541.1 hypothetical protein [Phocaeicola sartorii]